MLKSCFISKDQFSVIVEPPVNRQNVKTVTVYEDERFCLNAKFAEQLFGKMICIRFTPDAKHLCLEECDEPHATYKMPKNGARKFPQIKELLEKNRISFPAKYTVVFNNEESFWQGDLVPNPSYQNTQKRKDSKKN